MPKKYQRKEFIKLALLTNLGLYSQPLKLFATAGVNKKTASLPGDNVIYYKKENPEYDILRKGFNKRIEKFPLIIAACKNTAGVAEAVQYAVQNNLPVAIKSGGHCMEGFSCNDGGLVINLSKLNTISWVNSETVKVGPGCTLSELYDELLPKGKIIPGGSCGGVGIGGLVLGGGYGLLARRYGLTCDSLVKLIMVDGKGITRDSDEDKELLWACKGGGNGNFGVITELHFKVHPAPHSLQSFRFKAFKTNAGKAVAILKRWFELSALLPPSCFSAFLLNRKTVYILLTNSEKNNAAVQQTITDLTALTDKTTKTMAQPLSTALKVYYGRPLPQYFKNASAGLYKNFDDIKDCIDEVMDTVMATPGMIYQVNTLGGNIQNAEFERSAAFPHRAFPYFSELQSYWETEKQSKGRMEKFQLVQSVFSKNGISKQYRNYPDINYQNWESLYYGDNYTRLQKVKNRYDPNNIIRHEQSIKNS